MQKTAPRQGAGWRAVNQAQIRSSMHHLKGTRPAGCAWSAPLRLLPQIAAAIHRSHPWIALFAAAQAAHPPVRLGPRAGCEGSNCR